MKREAGILLPVSALPSAYGIGGLDGAAIEFVDFLARAGQSVWQILPLGPTGYGDSPYQSFSAFAGNPYLISLPHLCEDGLLTKEECLAADCTASDGGVDYGALYEKRTRLLRKAFSRSRQTAEQIEFEEKHRHWLENYALFMAKKTRPEEDSLVDEMAYYRFLQYRFFEDWDALKSYANQRGIRILGDLPIYVSLDSADVWCSPELFQMDENGVPTEVAGCPPDGFAPRGQLWGNPLYDWSAHEREGYAWWISRLSHAFSMYDAVRIDHFRGFDSYYAIPYGAPDATVGEWRKGPGMALFRAVEKALGEREIIAEDLGFMTDSVRELVRESGFAGMKILQFGFEGDEEHLPHNYPENSAAYTGTHDNPTLLEWLGARSAEELAQIENVLGAPLGEGEGALDAMIALLMRSRSRLAIVPMQDYLGLSAEARMNRPATAEGNWRWRMTREQMNDELCDKIRRLTTIGGRLP
ncbi:MAG: 4-alpha-glucanotransferase [Clostridia bacterium]|nr:4-alpha-glucanotransferase [Clostridia bacterium]